MTLTPNMIADRLETLVQAEFPGETVYRDLTPTSFTRPSTLIVHEAAELEADLGCGIIEVRVPFTLTTFVPTDIHHHSHLQELHARQVRLISLFLPGYIRVGDRAPKVRGPIKSGGGYDYDTVTVTLAYTLSRSEFLSIPQQPVAEALHLTEEVNFNG